ncbi:hypothetical protein AAFF_G00180600 [Aldrovandia affinis]|uniref:Uncharacterized protein n=1 Tax=Aldrovandia affinis TaxID=143900 RepID=A0AAD7SYI3_9TELE|nr:hypothetical protein AAFF_G00180600 [Aldrovandia affinis]
MRSYTAVTNGSQANCDVTGPVSYKVQTPDGQLHRRHVDQLRGRLGLRADTASTEPEIMVTCQGYLRNHHWNRPRRQGQERQTLPITLWLGGVLVDPCAPEPATPRRPVESVTRHGT